MILRDCLLYVSRLTAKGSGFGECSLILCCSYCVSYVITLCNGADLDFVIAIYHFPFQNRPAISSHWPCFKLWHTVSNFTHPFSSVHVTKLRGSLSVTRNVPLVGPTLGASCCIWSGKYIWSRYYKFNQMAFVFMDYYCLFYLTIYSRYKFLCYLRMAGDESQ